jgi:hypothetical protein
LGLGGEGRSGKHAQDTEKREVQEDRGERETASRTHVRKGVGENLTIYPADVVGARRAMVAPMRRGDQRQWR